MPVTPGGGASRFILAITLLAAGCRFDGVPRPEPIQEAFAHDPVLSAVSSPLPYRLALAPVRVQPAARSIGDATKHPDAPSAEEVRNELALALTASGRFARVMPRGTESSTPADVLDAAWNEQDDLVLEVQVRSYAQEYLGHSNYPLWFLAYFEFLVPAWYIPVDYYGVSLEAHASLRSTQGGVDPVFEETYTIAASDTVQELTPDDRELVGFLDLSALWNVENSLEDSNWRAIDRAVAPHAWRRLELALLRDLEGRVVRPLRSRNAAEREPVLSKIRRRFGLVAGISSHADSHAGTAPGATRDARAFAELLASSRGGALTPGRNLRVLADEAATASGILDAIAQIASRATSTDEAVIYLAGFGSVAEPGSASNTSRPVILAHDGPLPLETLGQALRAIGTDRLAVFIDASFGGAGGDTRTANGTAPSPEPVDLAATLRGDARFAVFFAARPDQGAHLLPETGGSLFGEALRAGISGAAARDREGRITLPELARFVAASVSRRAGLEGFEQEPVTRGAEEVELSWPR